MTKKRTSKFIAMLVALVMAASMLVTPVMANPSVDWAPDSFFITKILHMPAGTATPASSFTFEFDLVYVNGLAVAGVFPNLHGTAPSVADHVVAFPGDQLPVPGHGAGVRLDGTIFARAHTAIVLAAGDFPHGGTFAFDITETPDTNPLLDDCDYIMLTYSQAVYRMYVIVVYCEDCEDETCTILNCSGLEIAFVTFFRLYDDEGNEENPPVKVNAGGGGDEGGLAFTNIFVQTYDPGENGGYDPVGNSAMRVNKFVNTAGNRSRPHDFSITVTLPQLLIDNAEAGNGQVSLGPFTGYINYGTPEQRTVAITAGSAATFQLAHGETLYIAGVPIGTTYALTETGVLGYEQYATIVQGGSGTGVTAVVTPSPDTATTPMTVVDGLISNDTVRDNAVNVRNLYDRDPPMGVFLNNLPFIGLVVLSVGGLAGVAALKIRKSKNDEESYQ